MTKLQRKKGRKQWQEQKFLKAHNQIKNSLIEANGMTKTEIHKATGLSRVTVNKHLRYLLDVSKDIVEIKKVYHWGDKYDVMVKGLKADALLVEDLEIACLSLNSIISKMSIQENLCKWRREGQKIPNKEAFERGYITEVEIQELFNHQKKVFGDLRRSFVELAKILVKVDFGIITAEEDLSNVIIRFKNENPVCTVNPKSWL